MIMQRLVWLCLLQGSSMLTEYDTREFISNPHLVGPTLDTHAITAGNLRNPNESQ